MHLEGRKGLTATPDLKAEKQPNLEFQKTFGFVTFCVCQKQRVST